MVYVSALEVKLAKYEWIRILDKFQNEIKPSGQYEKMPYEEWRNINPSKPYDEIRIEIIDKSIVLHYYKVNLNTQKPICDSWFHYRLSKSSSFGQYLMDEHFNTEEKDMGLSAFGNSGLATINTTLSSSNDITAISDSNIAAAKLASVDLNIATTNIDSTLGWYNISDTKADKADMDRLKQEIDKLKVEIKNKEKEDKNMFDFDFGKVNNEAIRLSAYGIAVKNASNVWVSYDAKSEQIINVDILNISGNNLLYKIPVAFSQVKAGDTIIHARKPMFIVDFTEDHKAFVAVDIMAGEEKTIIPCKSPFGFDFVTKVVSIMDFGPAPDSTNPFGNMLPLMLMGDNKELDPMMMYFCMGMDSNNQQINPMMMYMLMGDKDKNSDDLFKMMAISNMMGNKNLV